MNQVEKMFEVVDLVLKDGRRKEHNAIVTKKSLVVDHDTLVSFAKTGCGVCGGCGYIKIGDKINVCYCAAKNLLRRIPISIRPMVDSIRVVGNTEMRVRDGKSAGIAIRAE